MIQDCTNCKFGKLKKLPSQCEDCCFYNEESSTFNWEDADEL